MIETYSFGTWLKQRRKQLRLTQLEVATAAYCSTAMIKKIEADERQPSPELAGSLADVLQIPAGQRDIFLAVARGRRPVDHLTPVETAAPPPAGFPTFRSQSNSRLPASATPFIGRAKELLAVAELLQRDDVRLVTLLGPGGMGKTRLAIETARAVQSKYADGALFVNLTAVTDPAYLPDALAHTLRLQLAGPADSQIIQYLRRRQLLLVLDNCEQLIGDGLGWLSQLLEETPAVKLLATSRERLNLAEEWLFPVPELEQAFDLFIQAAQRIRPDFDGAAEQTAVSRICQLVGNLPLAVELAASWILVMNCAQIADHVQQDLAILATNVRNVPERHRNIQALFDHSWQLLSAGEREVLMRLSVFRGGWTAAEATAVAGANLPLLRGLVEKSLVRLEQENRYDLHPLTCQYAAARLVEAGLETEIRQRHALTYLALAETLAPQALTNTPAIFARLEQEHDNLRAALAWVVTTRQQELAYRLLNQLWTFWFDRGYRNEAIHWFSTIIEQAVDKSDNPALCEAIFHYLPFLALQGRFSQALPYFRRAVAMAHRLEEPWLISLAKGLQAMFLPDPQEAEAAYQHFFELMPQLPPGSQLSTQWGTMYGLYGDFLRENGRYAEAEIQYQKSLALINQLGADHGWLLPIGNLGRLALQNGRLDEAHERFALCVAKARQTDSRMPLADWLLRLGESWLYRGNLEQAANCLQENITLCQEMGNPHSQADALVTLAQVTLLQGDREAAARHARAGFTLYQHIHQQQQAAGFLGGRRLKPELVDSLWRAGLLAVAQAEHERAAILFGAAAAWQEQIKHLPVPPLQAMIDEGMATVRNKLPAATLNAAWATGRQQPMSSLLAELATAE